MQRLLSLFFAMLVATVGAASDQIPSNNPNDYSGTDSERLAAAVDAGVKYHHGQVVVPPRVPDAAADRDYWLLDSAILLPSDATLELRGAAGDKETRNTGELGR